MKYGLPYSSHQTVESVVITRKYVFETLTGILMAMLAVSLLLPRIAAAQTATYTYTWKNVVTGGGGGYIPNIIFNPSQKNLIYARTDMGGAYRWDSTTSAWIPLLDFVTNNGWNDLGVESIATDPVDPTRLYIAVGTYTNSWTSANGAIMRSTDQGATFQRISLPFKNGGNMPGRSMGERLAVDPNLNSTIYFGTRLNGLWKSTDYGVTWNQVSTFTARPTYVAVSGDSYQGQVDGIGWVVIDPRSNSSGKGSQIIYAGLADTATSIYQSVDGGTTWTAVTGQPTGFIPQRAVLSSTGILYVTYSNGAGPYDGTSGDVWKFDTSAQTWTRISPYASTDTSDDYYGYGGLAVDAENPATIMVSALNSWWPDTIIFRSTNAGSSWTRIWDWTSYPSRSLRYTMDASAAPWLNFGDTSPVDPVPAVKLGWMVSGLQIDPFDSNHMLYGTGATMYGTSSLTNWDSSTKFTLSVAAAGIEETAVQALISPPSGATLLSCIGDVDGFRHTSLTTAPSEMFLSPNNTSCSSMDYAELSPSFVARVGTPDSSSGIHSTGFSYDNGVDWYQGSTEPSGVAGGGSIAAAADASRVVWSDSGAGVLYSTSTGSSWTASSGITAGAFVISDRVNPKKFYGFSAGTFYVSTDGGITFTSGTVSSAVTSGRIKAVPGIEGDVWVAGGTGGLWHSTNSGTSFTQISAVTSANTVGFGKAATGATYKAIYITGIIGGVEGFFRSDDEGATWVRINDDAHQYGATTQCITGDPNTFGRVYICTNGRGIVYGDASSSTTASFTIAPSSSTLSVTQGSTATDTITVTDVNSFSGSVTLTASGLPTGVTAAFGTNPTTGSSVVTFTAGSSATTGTSTVTITGTSGSLTASTTIALTVSASQSFTLAPSSSGVSVTQGSTATDTITVTDVGGFTGSVTLAASGLPTGVTATFATNPTTGSSVVTFTASSSATTGTSTVTITGTSGSLTASTTISLTVAASSTTGFACHVTYTISSQWAGGFGAAVALKNSGTTAWTSWTLTWTFANGQTISQLWNGTATQSGSGVTVTNLSYNGSVAAGSTYSGMGFNGTWNNTTNAVPASFAVNGTTCQ